MTTTLIRQPTAAELRLTIKGLKKQLAKIKGGKKLATFSPLGEEEDGDRDTWVTPWWLADSIGPVWLDPFWNPNSHIQAERTFWLEGRGEDAFRLARTVAPAASSPGLVWINPPYSHGMVLRAIRAFRHAAFCFLVRLDPSTQWFAELYRDTHLMLVPHIRVNFEPPPGLETATDNHNNPFPHVLMFARPQDASDEIRSQCYTLSPTEARALAARSIDALP